MSALFDLLFPARCILCGEVGADDKFLCGSCHAKAPFITGGTCPRCSKRESDCRCNVYDMTFDGAASAFYYNDAKNGVAALKRFESRARAGGFARYMAKRARSAFAGIRLDALLYVPMTKQREGERGYNQSRELCRLVSPLLHVPMWGDVLYKTRGSLDQKTLDAQARRDNLKDTFTVRRREKIESKTLLLIDDVLTTGATLSECARLLKGKGAEAVYCLVAATT